MAGLTWTRQPGMRVLIHPNKKVTFGFSAEQADQYIGGSAGGSGITLPTALSGARLDRNSTPRPEHQLGELSGASPPTRRTSSPRSPSTLPRASTSKSAASRATSRPPVIAAPFTSHTTEGAGLLVGFNVAVLKNLRLISTNFFSDGEGRYLFGQAPMSSSAPTVPSAPSRPTAPSMVSRRRIKNTCSMPTTAGIYIGRNVALDANGTTRIGYGYTGSRQQPEPRHQRIDFRIQPDHVARVRAMAPSTSWVSMNIWRAIPGSSPQGLPKRPTITPSTSTSATLCRGPCPTSKSLRIRILGLSRG